MNNIYFEILKGGKGLQMDRKMSNVISFCSNNILKLVVWFWNEDKWGRS